MAYLMFTLYFSYISGFLVELYVLADSKGSNFKGKSPGNEVAGVNGLSYPAGLSGLGEPTSLNISCDLTDPNGPSDPTGLSGPDDTRPTWANGKSDPTSPRNQTGHPNISLTQATLSFGQPV